MKRIADEVYAKYEHDRHKKEVEHVAKHDAAWIKEYMDRVKEKRGIEAWARLRKDVWGIWRKR